MEISGTKKLITILFSCLINIVFLGYTLDPDFYHKNQKIIPSLKHLSS